MKPNTYGGAGVDVDRGERFVELIKKIASPAVSRAIGGFAGAFEIDPERYRHPVLMTTTDGVGTKILVARELGRYDTIGIDLVAMCVNDLLVCGATPLSFLDYIACGRIDESILRDVMTGIVSGCERAACTLSGGETAELPDMYGPDEFDLAGFAVGVVEREAALPKSSEMREGDLIMALPSVGIHSNGLSLARKVVPKSERALWSEMLKPTAIYFQEMSHLVASGALLGAAHITGGGLESNLSRVLPDGLVPRFDRQWEVPAIFDAIKRLGGVDDEEMRRIYNMGIGIAFVVHPEEVDSVSRAAEAGGFRTLSIGALIRG